MRENSEYAKVPVFQWFFLLERLLLMDARAAINGIQEVSGSIPLISTKSSEEARKTLTSLDFKVFSFPKVGNSQYLLFVPVRLIFDGNFENQEVRYYEEN